MKKTHSMLFVPGIIMLGIVLRTPFTTLPTVLSDIAASLGVDVSSLGLLTSLPLLTFAIFSPFAIQFAKKLGIERLFYGRSDHQSHFLARFGQHLDSLVCSCFGHLDS